MKIQTSAWIHLTNSKPQIWILLFSLSVFHLSKMKDFALCLLKNIENKRSTNLQGNTNLQHFFLEIFNAVLNGKLSLYWPQLTQKLSVQQTYIINTFKGLLFTFIIIICLIRLLLTCRFSEQIITQRDTFL